MVYLWLGFDRFGPDGSLACEIFGPLFMIWEIVILRIMTFNLVSSFTLSIGIG